MLEFLFKAWPSNIIFLNLFLINLGLSVLLSYLLLNLISSPIIKNRKAFLLFLISLGTFIPLLGLAAMLFILLLLRTHGKDFYVQKIASFPQVEYSRRNPIKI